MGKLNVVPHPDFDSIDLGTRVTVSKMEKVKMTVDLESFAEDFGIALAKELARRNPQRLDAVNEQVRSVDEKIKFKDFYDAMSYYVCGLITLRLEFIHKDNHSWQKAKKLGMTPIIQEAVSCLGVMKDLSRGLIFEPQKSEFIYDIDTMLKISEMLEVFQLDGLKLHFDAFPKAESGDDQMMSCVIINDVVMTRSEEIHPSASYISVFVGLKCEAKSEMRFEVPYDSVPFIKDELLKEMVRKCFA